MSYKPCQRGHKVTKTGLPYQRGILTSQPLPIRPTQFRTTFVIPQVNRVPLHIPIPWQALRIVGAAAVGIAGAPGSGVRVVGAGMEVVQADKLVVLLPGEGEGVVWGGCVWRDRSKCVVAIAMCALA